MYALNTFLRLMRFLTNSFLGLIVGFLLGVLFARGEIGETISRMLS